MKIIERDKKIFYGVWITVAVWAIYFLSATPSAYGAPIVSTQVILQRGWNDGVIGLSSSIYYLSMSLISIPTSILIKKKGIRVTIILGALIGIVSYVVLMSTKTPVLYVFAFVGVGICTAMCAIVTAPNAVNAWFNRNKTLPMSVLMTAGAIGGFILPIFIRYIVAVNANICWLVFAGMSLLTLLIAYFVVKNKPEDVGEIRDGHLWSSTHPENEEEKIQNNIKEPLLRTCYRSHQFWFLAIQLFASRAMNAGLNSYIIIYAIQNDIPQMKAALLITIYNAISLFGRFSLPLVERIHLKKYLANALSLSILGLGAGMLFVAHNFNMFAFAVILCGYGFGTLVTLFPLLTPEYFGSGNFAVLNGTFNTLGTLGGFFAPLAVFYIAHLLGGYQYSYLCLGALLIACSFMAIISPGKMITSKEI